jgi:hypothetical protein
VDEARDRPPFDSLLQRMRDQLSVRGYSPYTVRAYLAWVPPREGAPQPSRHPLAGRCARHPRAHARRAAPRRRSPRLGR